MANRAQIGHFHLRVHSLLLPVVQTLMAVLGHFEGTVNLHCYTAVH